MRPVISFHDRNWLRVHLQSWKNQGSFGSIHSLLSVSEMEQAAELRSPGSLSHLSVPRVTGHCRVQTGFSALISSPPPTLVIWQQHPSCNLSEQCSYYLESCAFSPVRSPCPSCSFVIHSSTKPVFCLVLSLTVYFSSMNTLFFCFYFPLYIGRLCVFIYNFYFMPQTIVTHVCPIRSSLSAHRAARADRPLGSHSLSNEYCLDSICSGLTDTSLVVFLMNTLSHYFCISQREPNEQSPRTEKIASE